MKNYFFFICFIFVAEFITGTVTNNGAVVTVGENVAVTFAGDLYNASGSVTNSGTVSIAGNLVNDDSFTSNQGSSLILNGADQSFPGGIYENLFIENGDTKTLLGNATVNVNLIIDGSTLDLNGFTLMTLGVQYLNDGIVIENGGQLIIIYNGPEWYVSSEGSDTDNDGSEGEPFATIQHGIDAANDGDTIHVAAGTYVENINFSGKNITVSGEDRETTIIDGNQSGTVVVFDNGETTEAVLTGFTITNGGSSYSGGGISIVSSNPTIDNLIVENNSTLSDGGGIDIQGNNTSTISNVVVRNNSAVWGGGIYCHSNNPTLVNIEVTGNSASTNAGGIYVRDLSFPTIINCTVINNSTDGQGGGLLTWYQSVAEIKNSIIRGNSPTEIDHVTSGWANISYSNIQGGYTGTGNIDSDPLFVNASGGDYHLTSASPCIDVAHPDLDGDGNTWESDVDDQDPDGTRMDMGTYYYPQYNGPEWYVSTDGSDADNDGSQEQPFANIQHAINSANDLDSIFVAAGTYFENINISGSTVTITSIDGPESTIIDGGQNGRVITFDNPNNQDAVSYIEGFTVRNGSWAGSGAGVYVYYGELNMYDLIVEGNQTDDTGGGISIQYTNSMVQNSIIRNNLARSSGGLHIVGYSPNIDNCTILNNQATQQGGGVGVVDASGVSFEAVQIRNNSTIQDCFTNQGSQGAGIYVQTSSLIFNNGEISGNSSPDAGGGIFIKGNSQASFSLTSFVGNNAAEVGGGTNTAGGGIGAVFDSNADFENCTFFNNYAVSGGVGGFYSANSSVNISNSILWENNGEWFETSGQLLGSGNYDVTFSDVQGGYEGDGNIDADPSFCNASNSDLTLADDSPCVSSGELGANMGAFGVGCTEAFNNYSLSFDGVDDYVIVNDVDNLGISTGSISLWMNSYSTNYEKMLIRKQLSYFIGFSSDGKIRAGLNADTSNDAEDVYVYSDNVIELNRWYYITLTYSVQDNDLYLLNLYIDGELQQDFGESEFAINISEEPVTMGVSYWNNNYLYYFDGIIDEVAIFNSVLTESQVGSIYDSVSPENFSGLVGYWNFNEGEGTTLTDQTSNGNDGTINGATWNGVGAPIDTPVPVYGCTDPYAENYDPDANTDDGSCTYSQDPVYFSKANYADWALPQNQDRITNDVWITRANNQGIFNAVTEDSYDDGTSPEGTEWVMGSTQFHQSADQYMSWVEAINSRAGHLVGKTLSMHIIEQDLYFDVEIHNWTRDANGGGFSYTRTPAELNSFDYGDDAVYFEKENFADWALPENQDRITDDLWITRANQDGIFNYSSETEYQWSYDDQINVAPSNTLWSFGVTEDLYPENYQVWVDAVDGSPPDMVDQSMSLFIVSDGSYFDIVFHSWTGGGDGGGFSYTRTDQNGESITFTKEDYAEFWLQENQDRITDDVWITRGNQQGIFNIASEYSYDDAIVYTNAVGSPENTEWSFGITADLMEEDYEPWQAATDSFYVGQLMSLHVIEEDIYFDVVFHTWTEGENGGGFSYTRMPVEGPDAVLSGTITRSENNSSLVGAFVVAVAGDNSFAAQGYSDENGFYSLELVGALNYFVNVSYDDYVDHNEYIFVSSYETTTMNAALDIIVDGTIEGTLVDWYDNVPLANANVLFAYTEDGELQTIEATADGSGYFMVQVPGEIDYDIFLYAEGYWVEHDAFYLGSGESKVLSIGIPPIASAARLYGSVTDFDTDELIPYALIQLNCDTASDWDHTGALGTYRVFSYYPGECGDGALVVSASGYQTYTQSVGALDFEPGESITLNLALLLGDDPDPGVMQGTVYSNIDNNPIGGAELEAYNTSTAQLFSALSNDNGTYQLFLPTAEYMVTVTATGHQELMETYTIISGETQIVNFNLDQWARISGTVTNTDGITLSSVEVVALSDGEQVAGTFTIGDGTYELYLDDGTYDIGAGTNGYHAHWDYGVELSGVDVVLDISLEQVQQFDGGVAGMVYLDDSDNDPPTVTINFWNNNYNAYTTTGESGAYALELINGTYSVYAAAEGYTSIFIPDTITIENNVVPFDIYLVSPGDPQAPVIVRLEDVPNDQGGQMDLSWHPGDPQEYDIFYQYSVWRQDYEWTHIATVPYHNFDVYNTVVATLGDSTDQGIYWSTYMVTAHTIDPYVFFDSPPATGYSIDNLFPAVPQNLSAVFNGQTVQLDWSEPEDNDFAYHNIYRQDLASSDAAVVFSVVENFYLDEISEWGEFEYWVTALDQNGNESDPSEIVSVTLSLEDEILPDEFALQQNYPNPFNPSTQIRYALPEQSGVEIVIYNMLGARVRTLVSATQGAGYRSVLWNATNDQGDPVSAGMYIYTIRANDFYRVKKMILLK